MFHSVLFIRCAALAANFIIAQAETFVFLFLKGRVLFCKGPYLYSRSGNRNLLQRQGDCQGKCRGVRVTLPGVWHISCRSFELCISLHSFRTILIKKYWLEGPCILKGNVI